MKHLNPRQGITTEMSTTRVVSGKRQCETPKSPPGDYNSFAASSMLGYSKISACETPKSPPGDYNRPSDAISVPFVSVKHLNPRQGITTLRYSKYATYSDFVCETPKSPPGDYNTRLRRASVRPRAARRVKHLNPRQGITTGASTVGCQRRG